MVPEHFLRNATREDRRFIRKWTLRVAMSYAALALALVLYSLASSSHKDAVQASSASEYSRAASAPGN